MLRYFQKAFKITNDNIILATPLVLFLFLLSIYLGVAQAAPVNLASSILLLVTILFMLSAFFAGWFYMVKKAVDLEKKEFIIDEDKAKASLGLIKEIPVGVGEYFFSFIGASILYAGLVFVILLVSYKLGFHYIGDVGVSVLQLKEALTSTEAMKALVSSLSSDQLIKLNAWNILFLIVTCFYSFLTLFWPVQIVMNTKNPLTALFKSIRAIFKKPLSAIVLFLYITFINFVVSLTNAFSTINPILYFVSMLLYFYFLVYIVVLIFLYYDREMQPKSKDEVPSQEDFAEDNPTKSNCDSGADSIGQDTDGDKPGEDE